MHKKKKTMFKKDEKTMNAASIKAARKPRRRKTATLSSYRENYVHTNVPRGTYKNLAITTVDDVRVGNEGFTTVRGSLAKNPNPIASENMNSTSNSSLKGPIDLKIKKDSKLKRYPK